MTIGKKRPDTHIIGERGVSILKDCLPAEWVVREYHPDYGIDLSVELFEHEAPHITKGAHLFFQVKATEHFDKASLNIKNRSNVEKPPMQVSKEFFNLDVIKYTLDTDFLATIERMGSAVPVILAVVDVSEETVVFVCLSDYIEKILIHESNYRQQKSKTIYIPADNILDEHGLQIIEWYAKRPRFYALFNKVHYQNHELQYVGQHEVDRYIDHFIHILHRFDVWDEPSFIPFMKEIKAEIDYYVANGITPAEEEFIRHMQDEGEDVDAEIYEATYCDPSREVSFREAQRIQGLHRLWEKLSNLGNIFEDMCKESFLPTPLWMAINNST